MEHETYWVRRGEFQDDLESIIQAMDQPSTDGVNTYFVSKAGRQAGWKVALSGLGGDEIFGGYPSHRQIPKLVQFLAPLQAVPALGRTFRWVSAPILRRFTSPKYAGLLEYGTSAPDAYLLRRALYMPWELPHLLDPALARDGWGELRARLSLQDTVNGLTDDFLSVTALELCWYLRNQLLRDADWAGMSHSLEVRVPLVDVGLFRTLSPALAGELRPRKQALPQMVSPRLPEAVVNRPKTGFTVPLPDWLAASGSISIDRTDRGLRGWAKFLHTAFANTQ
jgi:asparagine synthase (glutamine-hydrolysing)